MAIVLLLALSVLPVPPAGATAGFAESHSELDYNDYAALHWVHPGDGCDSGKYCLSVHRKGAKYGSFKDFYAALDRVSLPREAADRYILAQANSDGRWLLYDLKEERYLARSVGYAEALSAWKSLGRPEPEFADARSAGGLHQTWPSFLEGLVFPVLLWLPFLSAAGALLLPGPAFLAYRRWRASRTTANAALFGSLAGAAIASLLFVGALTGALFLFRVSR